MVGLVISHYIGTWQGGGGGNPLQRIHLQHLQQALSFLFKALCQNLSTLLSFLPLPLAQQPTPTQLPAMSLTLSSSFLSSSPVSNRLPSPNVLFPLSILKLTCPRPNSHCLSGNSSSCVEPVVWSSLQVGKRERLRGYRSFPYPSLRKGQRVVPVCTAKPPSSLVAVPTDSFLWMASLLFLSSRRHPLVSPDLFLNRPEEPCDYPNVFMLGLRSHPLGFPLTTQILSGVALAPYAVHVSSGIEGL